MIFFGRPQERHEAWPAKSCPHAWLCCVASVEGGERRNASPAHLHAPFVFKLGNLLCRPDAIIMLVVTAAGFRQRGQRRKDEWCPCAPHLGGWCCGLKSSGLYRVWCSNVGQGEIRCVDGPSM